MALRRGTFIQERIEGTRVVGTRFAKPAAVTTQALGPDVVVGPDRGLGTEVEGNVCVVDAAGNQSASTMGRKDGRFAFALGGDVFVLLTGRLTAGHWLSGRERNMNLGLGRLRLQLRNGFSTLHKFLPNGSGENPRGTRNRWISGWWRGSRSGSRRRQLGDGSGRKNHGTGRGLHMLRAE